MTAPTRMFRLATLAFLPACAVPALPCAAQDQAQQNGPAAVAQDVARPTTQPASRPAATQPAATQPAATRPPATRPAAVVAKPPAADVAPAAVDENTLRVYRQQRDALRGQYANAPELKDVRLDQLLRFVQQRGVLQLQANFPAAANGAGRGLQPIKIHGINAGWQFNRYQSQQAFIGPNGRTVSTVQSVTVQRVELDGQNDADVYQTVVSSSGTYFSVSGASVLGRVTFAQNVAARNPAVAARVGVAVQPVTLTVTELQARGGSRVVFRGSARTFDELRARHPDEFRKHLMPVLARLSDLSFLLPGAADVYAAFPEIPADPQFTAKVEALLPDLDSDAFRVRESASRQLLDLGPPAVAAALRLDRDALTDEQKGQLAKLIAAHRHRDLSDPAEACRDAGFLVDCLEYGDPAVRTTARAQLEAVLGVPVAFDPSLSGPALWEASDAVRKQITTLRAAAATQPAAQPGIVQPAAGQPAVVPVAPVPMILR